MNSDQPTRWHTREDSGLRLDRAGQWWHDGELVTHPKIIEAFNHGITPAEDGRFKLQFGHDWCFVDVEDAAYRVRSVEKRPDGLVWLTLSDGTAEPLDPQTLVVNEQGILGCRVKARRAKAELERIAQFTLGEMLEEREDGLVFRQHDKFFPVAVAKNQTKP